MDSPGLEIFETKLDLALAKLETLQNQCDLTLLLQGDRQQSLLGSWKMAEMNPRFAADLAELKRQGPLTPDL